MGGAFGGVADDLNALQWNPAGLGRIKSFQISVTHLQWIEGVAYEYAAAALPIWLGTAGFGLGYFGGGKIDGRDAFDNPIDASAPYSLVAIGSYGQSLLPGFCAGGTIRAIQERMGDSSALAADTDVGVLYESPMNYSLGLSVQHLGTPQKFRQASAPLPSGVRLGIAYRMLNEVLTGSLEAYKPFHENAFFSAGVEGFLFKVMSLRAGYSTGYSGLSKLAGFGCGLGVTYRNFQVDYSISPFDELGNIHRVTLGWMAGESRVATAQNGNTSDAASKDLIVIPDEPSVAVTPSPPAGLAAAVDGDAVNLTWEPVPGAAGYHVYYRWGLGGFSRATSSPREQNRIRVKNLKHEAYEFSVSAVDMQGKEGLHSAPVLVKVASAGLVADWIKGKKPEVTVGIP